MKREENKYLFWQIGGLLSRFFAYKQDFSCIILYVIHFCDFLLLLSFLILPSQRVTFVVNDYGLCIHMSFQLAL